MRVPAPYLLFSLPRVTVDSSCASAEVLRRATSHMCTTKWRERQRDELADWMPADWIHLACTQLERFVTPFRIPLLTLATALRAHDARDAAKSA